MQTENRFEQLDRSVIEYVVTCVHNGTRFYIADSAGNPATDMLARARRYRDDADAWLAVCHNLNDAAWDGAFPWQVGRFISATSRLLIGDDSEIIAV